ncbi:MAG: DNA cytosine methyltransferase, partial [Acidobacteriia bacterium]|nr:DNA cytosine methyltransferase [Terriglobia bacterium]
LNLYAGLGGNRKLWENVQVTAVELDPKIAAVYRQLHPRDEIVIADAHHFLQENYHLFDFIWSSPPCQSHSKMDRANCRNRPRYADLKLYEEIIFLKTYHKGRWVVENVVPYYRPLVEPTVRVGRHLFWTNFALSVEDVPRPSGFIASSGQASASALKDWLGLHYEGSLYYGSNHCPAQVLRNCVHPLIGEQIFKQAHHASATIP